MDKIIIDKNKLYQLYVVDKLSIREVAKKMYLTKSFVNKRLDKHEWKRTYKESFKYRNTDYEAIARKTRSPIDKNELYRLYCIEGYSTKDLAKMWGLHSATVGNRLKKYNWIRTGREAHNQPKYIKKLVDCNMGKKASMKTRKKLSEAHKGLYVGNKHPMWTGGKPKCLDCGKKLSTYKSKRCIKCHLGHKGMSGLEKKVEKMIKKYNLPYKYVGDGKFTIGRKIPDFININGEKKAIEVYWKEHKNAFRNGGEHKWKQDRQETYAKYGWETIFIEGTGLTEKKVLNCIQKGGRYLFH